MKKKIFAVISEDWYITILTTILIFTIVGAVIFVFLHRANQADAEKYCDFNAANCVRAVCIKSELCLVGKGLSRCCTAWVNVPYDEYEATKAIIVRGKK